MNQPTATASAALPHPAHPSRHSKNHGNNDFTKMTQI